MTININDFKILSNLTLNYFETLIRVVVGSEKVEELEKLNDTQKSRLGFYILMIEKLTELSEFSDISNSIIDTEYNKYINSTKHDDFGVDAVVIEEGGDNNQDNHIKIFNFKYRESFKESSQSVNESILTVKFLNALVNDDFSGMSGKTLDTAKRISDKLESNESWKITLYIVSNEKTPNKEIDDHLKQFKRAYDMDIVSVGLSKISDLISLRPHPINSTIFLDTDAVMSFAEDSLSSSKSYIFRMSLAELIRITAKDSTLRSDYNIEDLNDLAQVELDTSVLFDNVRGFVLKSKFNENIAKTIRENPTKFFMYNNGLTLIANDIIAKPANGRKKIKIELVDFQVINGGQTLRTVHQFNSKDENNIVDYLSESEVLVRVFKTQQDSQLNSKVAEFTNSQNAISNVDLKSLRKEQLDLESLLKTKDILYSRKTGDIGVVKERSYSFQISMEKFGQILFSYHGMPEKAVNQKKKIFDKYYNQLFVENSNILDESEYLIKLYYHITNIYTELKKYKVSDQKIFYVIYIVNKENIEDLESIKVRKAIEFLEETTTEYLDALDEEIAESRIFIQMRFKKFLDQKIKKQP